MKKLIMLTILFAAGCGVRGTDYVRLGGTALGTTYGITVQLADTTGLQHDIDALFERASRSMSVYDPQSLLNRLNAGLTDILDADIAHCLAVARRVSELSDGVYDVTLQPVIEAWGFNAHDPQTAPNLDSLMRHVGFDKIAVVDGRLVKSDPQVRIDLNSVAKGHIVDLLAALVESRGATNYMLEVGGEIVCRGVRPGSRSDPGAVAGGEPWRIAIDKPAWGNMTPDAMRQTVLTLGAHSGGFQETAQGEPGVAGLPGSSGSDGGSTGAGTARSTPPRQALATSGNYRRYRIDESGRPIVHTIDGRTGQSRPTDMLSATVIAPSCAEADAMATMFMAVGSARAIAIARSQPHLRVYFVYGDNEVFTTTL